MRRIEKQHRSLNIFPLLLALLIGAAITFFVKDNYDKHQSTENKNVERLTKQADDLLSSFIQLQNLNEQYAKMLADKNLDSAGLKHLDSLNILISDKHQAFSQSLDSLQSKRGNYDKNSYILLLKITDAYIAALNQSNSINDTRSSLAIGNTNYNFNQTMLYAMQNELRNKQLQLINATSAKGVKNIPPSNYVSMMKEQDSIVSQVILKQKSKNQNIADYSNKLQRDNDRLTTEIQKLRESNTTNQVKNESTISSKQLSEQLDLARADCLLTRADARKIISNAKQRRDLLQQALVILNNLSRSNDASTRTVAMQKLNDLKVIAANNHD